MTTEETIILSNILALGNKVLTNDLTVETAVSNINSVTDTIPDYNSGITENVNGIIEKVTKSNKAVIVKIVNTLTSLADSKDLMLGLLDARTLDMSNITEVTEFVDKALASNVNDYRYYNLVTKLAITLGNSPRIQAAITKIDSLGV